MWDALDQQETKVASRSTVKLARVNPTVLSMHAKQYFKRADFSNSGRIDDEEAMELLPQVATHGGFALPPSDTVDALMKECCSCKGILTMDEFVAFVTNVATGKSPSAADEPTPTTTPPSTSAAVAPPHPTPPQPAGIPTTRAPSSPSPTAASAEPPSRGHLRVEVLEAEGLPPRVDGSACSPFAAVAVNEPTKRRTRRTSAKLTGPTAEWDEAFDFDATSPAAQVVVDVWDGPAGAGEAAEPLGKAVLSVADLCRPGVPNLCVSRLLEGQLVLRLLFTFDELPAEA